MKQPKQHFVFLKFNFPCDDSSMQIKEKFERPWAKTSLEQMFRRFTRQTQQTSHFVKFSSLLIPLCFNRYLGLFYFYDLFLIYQTLEKLAKKAPKEGEKYFFYCQMLNIYSELRY